MHIEKKYRKRYIILIIILLATIIIITCLFLPKKENKVFVSGRLEGYETDIAPKVGGIVDYVVAREGAAVHKGELLAKLDDSDIQARLKSTKSSIEISKQQEKQAKLQLEVVENQIRQAGLSFSQSKNESLSSIGQARASISIAQSQFLQAQEQLKQAYSDLKQATIDYKRYTNLVKNGSIPKHVYDQAKTKYDIAVSAQQLRKESLEAAEKQIEQAKYILIQAQSTEYNPEIRKQQVALIQTQLVQAKSQMEAAKSNILKSDADSLIKLGSDYIYNIQFKQAEDCFKEVITMYPDNPAGYFLDAMVEWWRIETFRNSTTYDDIFLKKIDKVL